MAKKKSLMDALSEYQDKNEFGRAQRKEEREKKMSRNASKTKTNTQKAFSTKQLLKTDKVNNKKANPTGAGAAPPLVEQVVPVLRVVTQAVVVVPVSTVLILSSKWSKLEQSTLATESTSKVLLPAEQSNWYMSDY